jgi:hypothetical protein
MNELVHVGDLEKKQGGSGLPSLAEQETSVPENARREPFALP